MAIWAGVGASAHKDYRIAAREAIIEAKANLGKHKIALAFLFSCFEYSSPYLLRVIASYLGNIPLIGVSSLAVFTHKGMFRRGIAVALLSLENTSFSCARIEALKEKPLFEAGQILSEELLRGFRASPRVLGIVLSDGLVYNNHPFFSGLQQRLGKSFPLIGACGSDNLRFYRTYQYFNQECLSNGCVALLWGGKINFGLGLSHGWKPLGKPHRITESEGNIIKEIDQKKAVLLYADYFAKDKNQLKRELRYISTLYPLGIYLEGEEEYLLRSIVSIQDDDSLLCQGNILPRSQVRLMISTKESCLAAAAKAAAASKKNLSWMAPYAKEKKPAIVFVFSSVWRYLILKKDAYKEIEAIKSIFTNTPIIGFYAYGEQAPLRAASYRGTTYSHNQSIAALTLQ
jgi:hypothetical protein